MARLLEEYKSRIVGELQSELDRKNPHAVPRLEKIVVSMGVGEAIQDRKRLDAAVGHLTQLAHLGQRVVEGLALVLPRAQRQPKRDLQPDSPP